ncbi:MAG: hypothetical protein Q9219_006477 [cf. Caloplaca sp. 3 TL-2023]
MASTGPGQADPSASPPNPPNPPRRNGPQPIKMDPPGDNCPTCGKAHPGLCWPLCQLCGRRHPPASCPRRVRDELAARRPQPAGRRGGSGATIRTQTITNFNFQGAGGTVAAAALTALLQQGAVRSGRGEKNHRGKRGGREQKKKKKKGKNGEEEEVVEENGGDPSGGPDKDHHNDDPDGGGNSDHMDTAPPVQV